MIEKAVSFTFTLTPAELANEFWGMDNEQQVEFFSVLGHIAGRDLYAQLTAIAETPNDTIRIIGEYFSDENLSLL